MIFRSSLLINGLVIIALFLSAVGSLFYIGPAIVKQVIMLDAQTLSRRALKGLDNEFDLPGKPPARSSSVVSRVIDFVTYRRVSNDNALDIFNIGSFEGGLHFGKIRSYAVYTNFGDRFLRGGQVPARNFDHPEYAKAFEIALMKGKQVTLTFKTAENELMTSIFIPLSRNSKVNSVGIFEVQEIGVEVLFARSIQVASVASAVVIGLLFIIVTWIMGRSLRARLNAESKVNYLSRFDALTGLHNRLNFEQYMDELLKAKSATLFLIDVDDFKHINDRFGHLAGDAVLKHIADILKEVRCEDCFITRWAGDEFVLVHSEALPEQSMQDLADRLISSVNRPVFYKDHAIRPSVSIGSACYHNNGDEQSGLDILIHRADMALLAAKAQKNKASHIIYNIDMDEARLRQECLHEKLKLAVEKEQLRLAFQPLFNLPRNKISGFEALLRWHDPELGHVSPAEFIPIAEASDLIVDIGTWVMRKACQTAASWPEQYGIAVNVSSVQMGQSDFVETVRKALRDSGLAAKRLELELTETTLLQQSVENDARMKELRSMGVGIAMDDFGTGHSSLTYLTSMNFSKLKIDKSFVDHVGDDGPNDAIINAVLGIAERLGLSVIAEGVETPEQRDLLIKMGCQNIQGYLYGKPTFDPFEAKCPVHRLQDQIEEGLLAKVG